MSATMRRRGALVRLMGRDLALTLRSGKIGSDDVYLRWQTRFLFFVFGALAASIGLDVMGFNNGQFAIFVILVVGLALASFYPLLLIAAGGLGHRYANEMSKGLGKWFKFLVGVGLFIAIFALTRWFVPVKNYPVMGLLLIVALSGAGFWTYYYKSPATYYKKYGALIITLSIIVAFAALSSPEEFKNAKPGTSPIVTTYPVAKKGVKSAWREITGWFSDEWVVVENVRCSPSRCLVTVKEAGKYQFQPRDPIELIENDGVRRTCEAKGISLHAVWGRTPSFVNEFKRAAPINNGQVCSLVAKVGGVYLDLPKEDFTFVVEKPGIVEFKPNAPAQYQKYFAGQLVGDLKKAL